MRLSSPTAWTRDLHWALGLDRGSRCGIVRKVTEWPATVDRRYHDAVIFDLACVVTEPAPGTLKAGDSTPLLLRRLRDVGVTTAVYSRTQNCKQALRSVGIDESVDVLVDAEAGATLDPARPWRKWRRA